MFPAAQPFPPHSLLFINYSCSQTSSAPSSQAWAIRKNTEKHPAALQVTVLCPKFLALSLASHLFFMVQVCSVMERYNSSSGIWERTLGGPVLTIEGHILACLWGLFLIAIVLLSVCSSSVTACAVKGCKAPLRRSWDFSNGGECIVF